MSKLNRSTSRMPTGLVTALSYFRSSTDVPHLSSCWFDSPEKDELPGHVLLCIRGAARKKRCVQTSTVACFRFQENKACFFCQKGLLPLD